MSIRHLNQLLQQCYKITLSKSRDKIRSIHSVKKWHSRNFPVQKMPTVLFQNRSFTVINEGRVDLIRNFCRGSTSNLDSGRRSSKNREKKRSFLSPSLKKKVITRTGQIQSCLSTILTFHLCIIDCDSALIQEL